MKYFTWLDIERVVRCHIGSQYNLPTGINGINCFSDAVEVTITSNDLIPVVKELFRIWFGAWFQEEPLGVILDIADSLIPIEFVMASGVLNEGTKSRPLWQDVAYVKCDSEPVTESFTAAPKDFVGNATVTAFHSFKGGVGRTTAIATFVTTIIESAKKTKNKRKLLLIDADLEAPGITYWFAPSMLPEASFVSFLEAMHYPPKTLEDTVKTFAAELKRTSLTYPEVEIFFLPASLNESQLLDTPVLPEHLARFGGYPWLCTDYICKLGTELEVDHIFVDLRAGFSEISSPLLFDPRIERFFVTTVAEQSVKGTAFILKKIFEFNSINAWTNRFTTKKPSVILSFLTKEIKSSESFDSAMTQLESSYCDDPEDNVDLFTSGLDIYNVSFAPGLMSLSDWEDALDKLKYSDLVPTCLEWIEDKREIYKRNYVSENVISYTVLDESIKKLGAICARYEYAEKGESEDLLITEPIRNLAKHYFDKLPSVVSVGAKGSGKTFNFLQLCSFITWENFLQRLQTTSEGAIDANIFPLLQSANLEEKARTITDQARQNFYQEMGLQIPFSPTDLRTVIEDAVEKGTLSSKLDWSNFWIAKMSQACGLLDEHRIEALNDWLISRETRVVFLFDGIEDTFRRIGTDIHEQQAVSALLELPNKLLELRTRALGAVIFLREDYLKAVLKQNIGQFLSRYNPYQLIWDADSFLRLVYWTCAEAGIIEAKKEDLDIFSKSDVLFKLEGLWGRKLGGEKEANSASWIYAALTDLKGRLQARDVIRLLRYACEKTVGIPSKNRDTLLSPQAIRNALTPCSQNKVEEATQEYLVFKKWVEDLDKVDPLQKKVPFDPLAVALDSAALEALKDIGVIFEDKDRDEKARFYIPEIYRSGLGFRLDKGARPRVLVLQKRAIGNNLI